MAERPTGTVTFLFTDVEGSTQLLKHLRERYGALLAQHQRLLREAFAAHGGDEIDTQGDAFFYVFSRARNAAAAAAEGQRALGVYDWPEGGTFRVRMGLHTGEPQVSDEGHYHGLGVHRAARIMAAAHGGQILASQATASVLGDEELEGVSLRDLGEHSLKDLDRPERIFQLDIEGLDGEFPALRTEAPASAADEFATPPRPPLHRRPLVVGAAAGVVAAAIAIPVFALGGGSSGGAALDSVAADSVGVVDSQNGQIVDDVSGVSTPGRVAVGEDAIWVASTAAQTVSRIDPQSHQLRQTIGTGSGPSGIAVGGGAVWVANTLDGTVSRIAVATNQLVQTIRVGNSPTAVAYDRGSVWVTNLDDQTLTRIDARRGRVVRTTQIGAAARGVAVGGGAVWVSDGTRNRIARVDPRTGATIRTINVGSGPTALAYGAGSLWVANSLDGTVSQIGAATDVVRATIPVGATPNGIAVSGNDVWVTTESDASLVRIDAAKSAVTQRVGLGSRPGGLALAGDQLWVTGQGSAAHRGGTLLMRAETPPDSIDPGNAYSPASWAFVSMLYDGLLGFKRVGGGDGTQLVPDLATSIPTPTDDGKTYTFQLRRGIRFSNGAPVTPAAVRRSIEREFSLPLGPGPGYFAAVVGASACAKAPAQCDLSRGIVTDAAARTVTFHLTTPDPELLYKLSVPEGAVVPADAPRRVSKRGLPGTGPYTIARYDGKRQLRLVRNPYFHVWSQAAKPGGYPDAIVLEIGGVPGAEVTAVERGRADVAFSDVPPDRIDEVTTQYPAQVHVSPQASTFYLQMNTREPPFDDVRARRAVNYALDRGAIVRAVGGSNAAQPTCQVLPPNFPGYSPYCPYTLRPGSGGAWTGPDLAKARALVRESGTSGEHVTLWFCSCFNQTALARIERAALEQLGYRTTLKLVRKIDPYFKAINDTLHTRPQIANAGWIADYPAASNFFNLLTCANATPSPNAVNTTRFCDAAIDREITRAGALQASDPHAAVALWRKIDRQVTDDAPWAALYTPRSIELVSARVGNYQLHPLFGLMPDQLWVK